MTAQLKLNGHLISLWQRGRRRFAIETQYRYRRWYPTSLFSACMRRAVVQLSQGIALESAASSAVTYFLAQAKQPGLDTTQGTNTYTLAMDFCAQMRTLLEYLSRTPLLTLASIPDTVLPDGTAWSFLAHADESGVLHRFVFTDYITQDEIYRQMHSWEVIGDMVAAKAPMTLHFFSIGKTENSRRTSPWCRAYKSPVVANVMRFQRKSGGSLQGDWKPVFFADNPANRAEAWVDQMLSDGIVDKLNQHIQVSEPDPVHAANVLRDIGYEARQIQNEPRIDPFELPMCRTQCDTPYMCPHQHVCYSPTPSISALQSSGLYSTFPTDLCTTAKVKETVECNSIPQPQPRSSVTV